MRWICLFCLTLLTSSALWSQQTNPEPRVDPKTGGLVYSVPAAGSGPHGLLPCPEKFDDGVEILREKRTGIIPPKATKTPPAKLTREAREAMKKEHMSSFEAVSVFSLVVSVDGAPQSVCLKKSAGYGLDNEAFKALERYHFDPATREGTPFPARIFMEINFKIE